MMTDDEIAELAKRVGLDGTVAKYPALVRAAAERGLIMPAAMPAMCKPTTEPAHLFVVHTSS